MRRVALCLLLVTGCRSSAPESGLTPAALERSVERAFGKAVRVVVRPAEWFHGRTHIAGDGTPVVHIDPRSDRRTTRVHELFHLLGYADGVPSLRFQVPGSWDAGHTNELLWLESQLRGAIQHAGFYGPMREMGLDPDANLRKEIRGMLAGGPRAGAAGTVRNLELRLLVLDLRAHLECSDPALVESFDSWFRGAVSPAIGALASEAVALLAGRLGSASELDLFVDCLGLLYRQDGVWDVAQRDVQRRGAFNLSTATLRFARAAAGPPPRVAANGPVTDAPALP